MLRCSTCATLHSDGPDHVCPPLEDWPEVRELVRQAQERMRAACVERIERYGGDDLADLVADVRALPLP